MNVNDVTRTIMQCRPDAILVSSLGTATSSVRLVTSDGPHFYFGAAMGSALAGALGLAEAVPDRPVVAVLGDGEFLMGASARWSVAAYRPSNLTVVVLADGAYSITGGQPIPAPLHVAAVANALAGTRGVTVSSTTELAATLRSEPTSPDAPGTPLVIEATISERTWPGPSPFIDPAATVRNLRASLAQAPAQA